MTTVGGCHCGAIRYEISREPINHALCHCSDCRRCAGAPMVGWMMFPESAVTISGAPATYASSEHGRRQFCPACGTGLFYINEAALPGLIDIQSATLDDPDAMPPQAHIQTGERISWMTTVEALPAFVHFPPQV